MPKLTTAKRIILGFAIAPLALVTVAIYALHDLGILKEQAVAIVEQDWPKVAPILTISNNLRENGKNTRDLLINDDKAPIYKAIDATRDSTGQALATLKPLLNTHSGTELYQVLLQSREVYVKAFTAVVTLIKNGQRELALEAVQRQLIPSEQAVYASLNAVMEAQGQLFESRKKAASALYSDAARNMLLLLVFCLALVAIAAYMVIRSVVRPLGGEPDEAAAVLREIAQGNLSVQIAVKNGDTDSVMLNLQIMKQNLSSMVQQISMAIENVASSSEELSTVSSQTSENLLLQGAEIEQAATAVNEMTAAVDEVARNAVSTSEASKQSEHTAQNGKQQVRQTVVAIGELSQGVTDTSDRIQQLAGRVQDITKVLDVIRSIAEQTNLLALNAAIEAARAGDAGRGFAVVADEVRALAHRTQVSTQEIEQMIGNVRSDTDHAVNAMKGSSTLVTSTLEVARKAGLALEEITLSISHINERNLLIASATEEQALVAREVDKNLVSIRASSDQVLNGAHHTNSASHELARMAGELSTIVSRFRI